MSKISLVGIAYGDENNVIGVRVWETEGEYLPGDIITYKVTIFSLGPQIKNIDLLVEARP